MKTLFFPLFICFLGCGSPTNKQNSTVKEPQLQSLPVVVDHFEPGKVIPAVPLRQDSSQSFALYLPKSYTDTSYLPVIIFFDPQGEGIVPIKLYASLAEQFGYILIGSNSSKNGLQIEVSNSIAQNLISESMTRFFVNKEKITLCGFSGGAKIALITGATHPNVSSIIYCGAAASISPIKPVRLLGFAGKRDMNYTDVVSFDWGLRDMPFQHNLVEWNGKHEFPDANVFKDAFIWLTSGKIPDYEKKQPTISYDKVSEEQHYKQEYLDAFQSKGLNWWKEEITRLNHEKKDDVMYERLLGFISLVCYSYCDGALKQNKPETVAYILTIYKLADPQNKAIKEFEAELKKKGY